MEAWILIINGAGNNDSQMIMLLYSSANIHLGCKERQHMSQYTGETKGGVKIYGRGGWLKNSVALNFEAQVRGGPLNFEAVFRGG